MKLYNVDARYAEFLLLVLSGTEVADAVKTAELDLDDMRGVGDEINFALGDCEEQGITGLLSGRDIDREIEEAVEGLEDERNRNAKEYASSVRDAYVQAKGHGW